MQLKQTKKEQYYFYYIKKSVYILLCIEIKLVKLKNGVKKPIKNCTERVIIGHLR